MLKSWVLRLSILTAFSLTGAALDTFVLRPAPPPAAPPSANGVAPVASEPLGVPLIDAVAHYDNGTAVFADARPLEIFKDGHIAGAYHLDVELFRQGRPDVLDLLPTDMPIIVYCGGGECDASKIVKRLLNSHGFADVLIFEEGYPAWQAAGYPVETGEPAL